MDQKGLKCHPTKTVCISVGDKEFRAEVKKQVESEPVMFGDFIVKFKESEVYLGDVIAAQGLEKSVELTINRRLGKVKGAMNEAKAIMEDFQMQAIGGMAGTWDLWERAILPSLIANCGSWIGIGTQTYKTLNEIQNTYLRMIYSCPPSTPLLALRTQAGMMDLQQRIWVEKGQSGTRIWHSSREEENLCREVLEVPDILNVSTITTSGCVKFSLAGVNLLLRTYGVFLYLIFCLIVILFLCKKSKKWRDIFFFGFNILFSRYF